MKAHKNHVHKDGVLFRTCLISMAALIGSATAHADVQYRVGYDAATSEYSIYMTPDSVPNPDVLISAQVTLVAPVQNAAHFSVQNMQSFVPDLMWNLHSRVDTPIENMSSDYLSFGSISTGSTPPLFGWVAGEEKKIFSFISPDGCVDGVGLIESTDPFNSTSNSAQTNPGNYFSNLGWASENNYTGHYGGVVNCSGDVGDNNNPPDDDEDGLDHHDGWNKHFDHDGKKRDKKEGKKESKKESKQEHKRNGKKDHHHHTGLRDRKEQPKRSLYILP